MIHDSLLIKIILFVIALMAFQAICVIGYWIFKGHKPENVVKEWASSKGFKLLSYSKEGLLLAKFTIFFLCATDRYIYRISVKDKYYDKREGYICLGATPFFRVPCIEKTKVHWDDFLQ